MTGSDGRSAGDYGDQASPGGIPPSFGASSPPPPPPAAPGPAQAAPEPRTLIPALPGPAAGPFANPAAPPRRGVPGLSRLAKPRRRRLDADFAGYCQHIGHRTAELVASNAYGWRCTLNPNIVLKTVSVCAWTYHLSTSRVIDVSTNYSDPSAWQCWRINRDLGVLDFTKYCVAAGHGTSKLVANNAYGWQCTSPAAAVDTTAACDLLYHVTDAVSRFAVFSSPYFWQCWN